MQNQQRPPQKMSRAEYYRRQAIQKRKRQQRMTTLLILLLLLFLIVFLVVFYMMKRSATNPSSDSAQQTTASVTDSTPAATDATAATEAPEEKTPEVSFQADLSAYEAYMNPENRDDYLTLVNPSHPIDADNEPNDLIPVVNSRSGRTEYMREVPEKALEALYIEAEAAGMTYTNPATSQKLSVMSGYRSYTRQQDVFNDYVSREMAAGSSRAQAEAHVSTYSFRAGTSEHQTGLCCDMHNLSTADESFKTQDAAKWLAENCWKFGFILRFPDGKTDITGATYEPWHFRYVGRYHAYRIMKDGLCLEEYLETLDS